jgi:hypothetical protein
LKACRHTYPSTPPDQDLNFNPIFS